MQMLRMQYLEIIILLEAVGEIFERLQKNSVNFYTGIFFMGSAGAMVSA